MECLGPLAALLILLHQTGALLKISTSSTHRTFAGSDVLLHCTFSIGGSSPDPRFLVIMWFYQGKEIVKYQEKAQIFHPRLSFDEQAARSGNASILLSNTTFEDEGIYMCSVTYSSEKMEEEIILNVLVSPKIQIPDKAVRYNNGKTLVCSVRDFYPVDIAIAWLRDGKILRNSSLGKIQRNENGTYSVDSTVTITPDHERKEQTFSCRVQHESLPVPLQEDFQLVYEVQTEETSSIPVIIGVCCAAALLVPVFGIGLLLIWKLKSRKKAKPRLVDRVKPSLCVPGEILYSLHLDGFYPRNIQILWTCVTGERQEIISSEEQLVEHSPLTFSVCSEARISEQVFTDPTCKVRVTWKHGSMDQPQSTEMSILDPDFSWRPVVEEIQTPRLFLDVPVQLECKISGYLPDALVVTWLIVKGGGAEETLMMGTNSISITTRREADLTYSSAAILTVTPSLETHHWAVIMCRVQHPSLEKPIERSTGALRVTAKPRLVKPVKMTLRKNSRIQISLCLERFYPGDLEITWSTEGNQSKYLLSSTESVTEGKDLTFNVTSDCIVSGYFFAEPRNKVLVEWKHESLDAPECRSWSLRDLPWRPVMEDILIPKLEAGKEAALSCKISGYFPDSLSVQWIKKEKGNESEIKSWTRGYRVSDDKSNEETDKTFTREARLTFTPHPERDRGAEFICRVTHPTLEEPIEKRTGPLLTVFKVRPDVSDIKLSISKRIYLEVNKFYPRDIGITWRLDEASGGNQC